MLGGNSLFSGCDFPLSPAAWTTGIEGAVSALPADAMAASEGAVLFYYFPLLTFSLPTSLPPFLHLVIAALFRFPLESSCLIFGFTSKVLWPSLFSSLQV